MPRHNYFPGLELYRTYPAQLLMAAGQDLDDCTPGSDLYPLPRWLMKTRRFFRFCCVSRTTSRSEKSSARGGSAACACEKHGPMIYTKTFFFFFLSCVCVCFFLSL